MPVGVVGAGAMGMGIVASLVRNGYPVTVRDIAATARDDAVARGAALAATPADLARACPVFFMVVVDATQMEDVLFGPGGAAAAMGPGHVAIASSTVAPGDVARLAQRLAATGARLVDAPISGGPQRAHDGTMSMMAAADTATLDRCAPLFAAVAARVFRVGTKAGDGARFKVINNMLAGINLAAAAEAMALAARAGLDPALVLDVVGASSGASWIFADRMPRAIASDYAPRAAARILTKDVGLAVDLAASHGMTAPLAQAAHAAFAGAVADGLGDEDDATLYKWNRRRAGLADG